MTEPITQAEIESEILRLSSLAEKVTHELRKRGEAAAYAEAHYRAEYAQAYLGATGTVGERESQAALATQTAFLDRRRAEAILDAAKEAGRNYRAQLDALRSVNSNLRALVVGS